MQRTPVIAEKYLFRYIKNRVHVTKIMDIGAGMGCIGEAICDQDFAGILH